MQDSHIEEIDSPSECRVCLGVHDEDIHDATVTIHLWLRSEIARRTQPEEYALDAFEAGIASSIPDDYLPMSTF